MSQAQSPQAVQKPQQAYDFTRRKRWADIIVTDAADVIVLILSAECKILYCGNAVTEILGWKGAELIDLNLLDLIPPDEQMHFRAQFEHSLNENEELIVTTHLKHKSATEPLFEIQGYPHYYAQPYESDNYVVYFAAAKPCPGRNADLKDFFQGLKIEHERLQQRLLELRTQKSVTTGGMPNHIDVAQSIGTGLGPSTVPPKSHYPARAYQSTVYNSMPRPRAQYEPSRSTAAGTRVDDGTGEDASRRKKPRKGNLGDQYVCVTCGRTDSPEWRKGPQGPKTLCNACGLRWAKQMRKGEETSTQGTGPSGGLTP